jgi:hypothetical protein
MERVGEQQLVDKLIGRWSWVPSAGESG